MQPFFKTLQTAFTISDDALVHKSTQKVIVEKEYINTEASAVALLSRFLYGHYYNETDMDDTSLNLQTNTEFEQALAQIFPQKRQQSEQWKVVGIDENPANLYVQRGGITLLVNRTAHLPLAAAQQNAQKNDLITITFPCQFPNISNGFYVFKSEYERNTFNTNTIRVYFNLKAARAVVFTKLLLEKLYDHQIAFEYKVFKYINTTRRSDNAVLYVNASELADILELLNPLFEMSSSYLNAENSIFHHKLFPGIGLAEEPLQDTSIRRESYGTHRCRLLAEAIYQNLDVLQTTGELPHTIFNKALQNHGIDPAYICCNGNDSALYKHLQKSFALTE